MQISNSPLTFYPPVPTENRNSSRLPVTVDSTVYTPATVSPKEAPPRFVDPFNRLEDQQQARFIRNFRSSDSASDDETGQPAFLPRAVQQYLYIDALPAQQIQQQGRLLDEMV
jgi:hypothetical protein